MADFIKRMIETQAKISLEAGQAKYRAYFVATTLYSGYKTDVDAGLVEDGYEDVIVTE